MKLGNTFNKVGAPSVAMARVAGLCLGVACMAAFAQGTTRLELPTVYVRSGSPTVSVILDGRAVASSNVAVKQTTFVVVTLTGAGATIASTDQDPTAAR